MRSAPIEKSDSLKKALSGSRTTFDEADYYKSKHVEMGGEDALEEEEEFEDDDEEEFEELYGDED